jgi:ribonuclease D
MPAEFVEDPISLQKLCAQIATADWVALDTEFMREKTYFAQLCLIQVATEEVVACVDPLAVDISPLLDVLYSERLLKVIHAARQDLEVLCDLRHQPPVPVFDTQIAAALAGFDPQLGYGTLVESLTGTRLQKAHTRADWHARPLTPDQRRYAEDDVRYLRDVFLILSRKLTEAGRDAWLREDCEALTDVSLYRSDPEQAYRRLSGGQQLPISAQSVLRELAAWRERTAKSRDLPRSWVAQDSLLFEIARNPPDNVEDLMRTSGFARGFSRSGFHEIIEAVANGRRATHMPLWPDAKSPDPDERTACKKAAALVRQTASELGIAASIVGTRKDIQDLVVHGCGPLTRGWRRQIVGDQLLEMFPGAAEAPPHAS